MRIIGIDPGERWVGLAALWIDLKQRVVHGESRVFDAEPRGFAKTIRAVVPLSTLGTIFAAEDFRVRPLGHNAFTYGVTLRLLGGLQYAVEQHGHKWELIPPGKTREVPMIFGSLLDAWRDEWPLNRDPHWEHCLSAWRVLGRYLLRHDPAVLAVLRKPTVASSLRVTSHWLSYLTPKDTDLVAPTALWTVP